MENIETIIKNQKIGHELILSAWDKESKRIQAEIEQESLVDEREANGLSKCCGAPITGDYARCSDCGENV